MRGLAHATGTSHIDVLPHAHAFNLACQNGFVCTMCLRKHGLHRIPRESLPWHVRIRLTSPRSSVVKPAPPGLWRWLWVGRDGLRTVAGFFVELVMALLPGRTYERLNPRQGLLAPLRRALHRFPRFAHQPAQDFRFRFFVDSDSQLRRVPSLVFVIFPP